MKDGIPASCRTAPRIWHHDFLALRLNRRVLEIARREVLQAQSPRVLDAGCGSRPFEVLFPRGQYVGLDLSTELGSPDIIADNAALPFRADSFDLVIASETLEHTKDYRSAVREFLRVTRPGGLVYVSVPFLYPVHGGDHDYQRFTEAKLRYLFAGNEIVTFGHANSVFSAWLIGLEVLVNAFVTLHPLTQALARPIVMVLNSFALALDWMLPPIVRFAAARRAPASGPRGHRKRWSDEVLESAPAGYALIVRVSAP